MISCAKFFLTHMPIKINSMHLKYRISIFSQSIRNIFISYLSLICSPLEQMEFALCKVFWLQSFSKKISSRWDVGCSSIIMHVMNKKKNSYKQLRLHFKNSMQFVRNSLTWIKVMFEETFYLCFCEVFWPEKRIKVEDCER